jgi:hypothetical protein
MQDQTKIDIHLQSLLDLDALVAAMPSHRRAQLCGARIAAASCITRSNKARSDASKVFHLGEAVGVLIRAIRRLDA